MISTGRREVAAVDRALHDEGALCDRAKCAQAPALFLVLEHLRREARRARGRRMTSRLVWDPCLDAGATSSRLWDL